MKRIFAFLIAAFLCLSFCGCASNEIDPIPDSQAVSSEPRVPNTSAVPEGEVDGVHFVESAEVTDQVKIEMVDGGIILLDLYPDTAPISVKNFQDYVAMSFYDGLTFHRIVSGFMIQGGDPTGIGSGDGTLPRIKGEFSANGVQNDLKHTRGVLSMCRSGNTMSGFDTGSCQFFICHKTSPHLDGQYAAFGKMIAGWSTLDAIASVQTDANDRPLTPQTINTVRFVTAQKATSSQEPESSK